MNTTRGEVRSKLETQMWPQARTIETTWFDRLAQLVGSPRLESLSGKSKYRIGAVIIAVMIAGGLAAFAAPVALAAPASGEDQYLEQVPLGGGPSADREKAREDFAKSIGGKDGVVTEADVRRAADKNRAKAKRQDPTSNSTTNPPPAAQSVATAARYGPLSLGAICGLLAILLGFGCVAFFARRRAGSQ